VAAGVKSVTRNFPLHHILRLLLVFLLYGVGGCSYLGWTDSKIDYSDSYDFSTIQKMAFLPRRTSPEALTGFSKEQSDRINLALERAITGCGITVVDDVEQADVMVTWHLVLEDRSDARSYDSNSYYNCWRCGPAAIQLFGYRYTAGTLIVDIIDRKISQSVWRGVIHTQLGHDAGGNNTQANADATAREMFQNFPPQ
jgi:hypothetical protein